MNKCNIIGLSTSISNCPIFFKKDLYLNLTHQPQEILRLFVTANGKVNHIMFNELDGNIGFLDGLFSLRIEYIDCNNNITFENFTEIISEEIILTPLIGNSPITDIDLYVDLPIKDLFFKHLDDMLFLSILIATDLTIL